MNSLSSIGVAAVYVAQFRMLNTVQTSGPDADTSGHMETINYNSRRLSAELWRGFNSFEANNGTRIYSSFILCLTLPSPSITQKEPCYSKGDDLKSSRRGLLKRVGATGIIMCASVLSEDPVKGMERLPYKPEGYNFWTWHDHKIHYVVQGEGPPIVLIHGFGASAFHWRYNIPQLAKKFKVYAVDLLGFGWSEKAIIDYNAFVWRNQVSDFLKEIVKEPAILVGNSLGGFTALITAADCPEFVSAVAILNSAGQFGNPAEETKNDKEETAIQRIIISPLKNLVQRAVLSFAFWQAKQPARITSVLKSVYPNSTNVDDYLIESIIRPADDPNAGEVYY
ncbi:hypothetical protein KI387_021634, partial [Taxus chinensis]